MAGRYLRKFVVSQFDTAEWLVHTEDKKKKKKRYP